MYYWEWPCKRKIQMGLPDFINLRTTGDLGGLTQRGVVVGQIRGFAEAVWPIWVCRQRL